MVAPQIHYYYVSYHHIDLSLDIGQFIVSSMCIYSHRILSPISALNHLNEIGVDANIIAFYEISLEDFLLHNKLMKRESLRSEALDKKHLSLVK